MSKGQKDDNSEKHTKKETFVKISEKDEEGSLEDTLNKRMHVSFLSWTF